jgi:hypothetical protein
MEEANMSNQRNRPNASRKKRRKKVTSPAKPVQPPGKAKPEPLPPMTSEHIAKVLSGFMTLRSTIQDLSKSIQKLENIMDSAYKIFELSNQMKSAQQAFPSQRAFPMLPPPDREHTPSLPREEDIPVIDWPDEKKADPPSLFSSISIGQILELLQSPWIQRMIAQLFRPKTASTSSYSQIKRKQG